MNQITPAEIIELAQKTGVPFGAHAFVVAAIWNDGTFKDAWSHVRVSHFGDTARAKEHADEIAAGHAARHTDKTFVVLEVGAPAPDAEKLYADGFADGANQQGGYAFGDGELATVLAALRFWQRMGNTTDLPEMDIATNGGEIGAMPDEDIDLLCESLNGETDNAAQLRRLIANGLTFGETLNVFGEHQREKHPELSPYAEAVDSVLPDEASFDSDDTPIVSKGDDAGADVLVWAWVSYEDAGIAPDDDDADDETADVENEACATGHPAKKTDLNADGFCSTCAAEKA